MTRDFYSKKFGGLKIPDSRNILKTMERTAGGSKRDLREVLEKTQ